MDHAGVEIRPGRVPDHAGQRLVTQVVDAVLPVCRVATVAAFGGSDAVTITSAIATLHSPRQPGVMHELLRRPALRSAGTGPVTEIRATWRYRRHRALNARRAAFSCWVMLGEKLGKRLDQSPPCSGCPRVIALVQDGQGAEAVLDDHCRHWPRSS